MALDHIRCFECDDTGHVAADCPNRAAVAKGGKPAWCGMCDEQTRLIGLDAPARCQQCHPNARRTLPQHRRCPRCHALVHQWDNAIDCASHARPHAPDQRPERDHIRQITGTKEGMPA